MGKKSTPSPDAGIGTAAQQMANISQDEWNWFQNQYLPSQNAQQQVVQGTANTMLSNYLNNYIPNMEQQYTTTQQQAGQVEDQQLAQMTAQAQQAQQLYGAFDTSYLPLYGQIASEAAAKGGQADQDYQAMLARGDVAQQYANAATQQQQYLAQYGMSPTSGIAVAGQRQTAISQAAQEAAAQTAARQAAVNLGWTWQTTAAQLGQGLLSAGSTAYGNAATAGQNAVNTAINTMNAGSNVTAGYAGALNTAAAPIQSEAAIANPLSQGTQAATGAASGSATALNQQYQTQGQIAGAQQQGFGSMVGGLLGAAGTIGGAMLGGPAGAAVGGSLGSAAGKAIA